MWYVCGCCSRVNNCPLHLDLALRQGTSASGRGCHYGTTLPLCFHLSRLKLSVTYGFASAVVLVTSAGCEAYRSASEIPRLLLSDQDQWGSPSASDPRAKNTGQRATKGTVLTSQSLSPWCDCRRLGSTLASWRWQDINVGNPLWRRALLLILMYQCDECTGFDTAASPVAPSDCIFVRISAPF